MEDVIIPALGVICLFGLPAIGATIIGYLWLTGRTRERLAMIEQGIVPQDNRQKSNPNRFVALRNGILMVSMALGALIGIMIDCNLSMEGAWHYMLVPITTVLCGGVGFIGYFFLARRLEQKEPIKDAHLSLNE